MEIQKPKAILFDWDNTLADTWPTIHQSLNNTFVDMGQEPWSFDKVKTEVHRSMRDYFPEIFGNDWEKASDLYMQYFKQIHLDKLAFIQGAEDVLKHLKDTSIYTAVVSNKTGSNLRLEVEHAGWGHYFDRVVGAKDAEEDKPSPHPVYKALLGSGIAPSHDVWFVGDSVTDLECAHNSSCLPVFYGDQDLRHERFQHCQPMVHFQDHEQLLYSIKQFT